MTTRSLMGSIAALAAAVFLLDCSAPFDWPFSRFYLLCILLTNRMNCDRKPYVLAAVCSTLTFMGFAVAIAPWPADFQSRVADVLIFWIVAYFVVRMNRFLRERAQLAADLERHQRQDLAEAELRLERDRFNTIAATSPGVICSLRRRPDGTFCFPYVSPVIVNAYGFQPEILTVDASPIFKMVFPDDAVKVQTTLEESARTLTPWHEVFRVYHPQKGVIWIETNGRPAGEQDGSIHWHGFVTDVTERHRAEQAIAGQNRVMEQIATGASLAEILKQTVELIEAQIPNSLCSILLFDAQENRLRFGAGPRLPQTYSQAIDGVLVGPDVGSCGTAVFRRESVVVSDVTTSPLWNRYRELALENGLRSCWSVPIFSRPRSGESNVDARVLGTFAIYQKAPWEPGDEAVKIVGAATYLAGIAIEREADVGSLKQSEERYRLLVDNAPVGIYVNVDNKFAYVNEATCRLMRAQSKDQLIGRSTLERFPREVLAAILGRIDRVRNHGESVPLMAHQYLRMDGTAVDVETMAIPIQFDHRSAVQVLINDVSAKNEAEEKLRATEKRLAMLFRSIPVGICITTLEDGKVVEANDVYLEIAGFRSEEIVGSSTIDSGQWLDPNLREQLVADLKKHGSVKNWEVAFRRRDGTIGYSLRSFERLMLDSKDCILTIVSDITDRKQLDEELRTNRQRLEMLSRQLITTQETERRHLARELHDEIGQMLTAVKMNLYRSQRSTDSSLRSSLEENVAIVEQAIDQVRNLSLSLRPPQLDQLGLVAALHWVVKYQARIGGFQEHLDAEIGNLKVADDVAIVCFRITQEALTNAVRHASPRNIRVELKVVNQELSLTIQDDGVGFDVLQARHRATSGASLGLLSMQERMSLVGGRLKIDSVIGKGTSIQSWFPIQN